VRGKQKEGRDDRNKAAGEEKDHPFYLKKGLIVICFQEGYP